MTYSNRLADAIFVQSKLVAQLRANEANRARFINGGKLSSDYNRPAFDIMPRRLNTIDANIPYRPLTMSNSFFSY